MCFKLVLLCSPDRMSVETPAWAQIWVIPSSSVCLDIKFPNLPDNTSCLFFSVPKSKQKKKEQTKFLLYVYSSCMSIRGVDWSSGPKSGFVLWSTSELLFISIVTLRTSSTLMKKRHVQVKQTKKIWHVHLKALEVPVGVFCDLWTEPGLLFTAMRVISILKNRKNRNPQ